MKSETIVFPVGDIYPDFETILSELRGGHKMQPAGDRPGWIKYDFDYLRREAEVVFITCCRCARPIENKLGICDKCREEIVGERIDG